MGTKISQYPAAAAFATTQEYIANDSGTTRKVTGAQIKTGVQLGAILQGRTQSFFRARDTSPISGANPPLVGFQISTGDYWLETRDYDSNSSELASLNAVPPLKWNAGTVTCKFHWVANSASTLGVVWQLGALAASDGDTLTTQTKASVQVTDANQATYSYNISPETGALTIAQTPIKGDMITFLIARLPADAADALAVDARLVGIELFWTSDAQTD